jgi:glycerol-3-phosphate acyltransferase PlsY
LEITILETFWSALLVFFAFWLGACPFSVWIGWWATGKDIRTYGDGNPGAANVFRAGGRKSGCLALVLDVIKGAPFVALAYSFFELPVEIVIAVAMSAILGHAFSPILCFRGGKSVAVTYGVLLALPQYEMLIIFTTFMFLGFLFIKNDSWTVMLGPAGSLAYLLATGGTSWESLFMLAIFVLFTVKHFNELKTVPKLKVRLIDWFQSIRRVI